MSKRVDLTGRVFGALTVIELAPTSTPRGQAQWLCRCNCGNEITAISTNLIQGGSKSCGCVRRHNASIRATRRNTTHGHCTPKGFTSEYRSWQSMIGRCKYPCVNSYEYYGGRGITVCERWQSFDLFLADMGPKPTPKHTIDRKDSAGHYEPDNCRWADAVLQRRNQGGDRLVEFEGKQVRIVELAERTGLSAPALWRRIWVLGWTVERAAATPIRRQIP